VSRAVWALLVGPYWLAEALNEGCLMRDFFCDVEDNKLRDEYYR
jgi:hypothetical protein